MNSIEQRSGSRTQKLSLYSMGYPDLIIKKDSLSQEYLDRYKNHLKKNKKAMHWHGLSAEHFRYLSIESICREKQWHFSYFDIKEGTGESNKSFSKIDLNKDIPDHLYSTCDLMIDSGTAEHCFNIGKVFENYFYMLKPNGILVQFIPFFSANHGFWSINPTTVFDMSSCNPIKIMEMELQSYESYKTYFSSIYKRIEFNPTKSFQVKRDESDNIIILFFVYKKTSKSLFKYPVQAKYRR